MWGVEGVGEVEGGDRGLSVEALACDGLCSGAEGCVKAGGVEASNLAKTVVHQLGWQHFEVAKRAARLAGCS